MRYLLRFLTWRARRNHIVAARYGLWVVRLAARLRKSTARSQALAPARALPPTRARHLISGDGV